MREQRNYHDGDDDENVDEHVDDDTDNNEHDDGGAEYDDDDDDDDDDDEDENEDKDEDEDTNGNDDDDDDHDDDLFTRCVYGCQLAVSPIVTHYWSQVRRSMVSTDTANDIAIVICAQGTLKPLAFLQSNALFHIHAFVCIHQVL